MKKINHNSLCETETFESISDNDIKKALECCSKGNHCRSDCPYDGEDDSCIECTSLLTKDALDLINRQQAEIEKLNVELVGMRGACESYKMHYDKAQAEIERSNKNLITISNACKERRNEAIKEFAERLKQEIQESKYRVNDSPYARACNQVADWCIEVSNNLVKEMTESPTKIEHSSLCETDTYEVKE